MRNYIFWIVACLLALSSHLSLGDELRFEPAPLSSGLPLEEPDFLPVEEAYQLIPERNGQILTLHWQITQGYYLYRDRFSAELISPSGERTSLSQEFESGVIRYDDYYEKEVEVYYNQTRVTVQLPEIDRSSTIRVTSQGCADAGLCYPPRTHLLKVSPKSDNIAFSDQPTPASAPGPGLPAVATLPLILFFAFLGGLILNLMPCVFPVLSIKILSLTASHLTAHKRHAHGFAYTAGVIASFILVALLLIALRASGQALGWGFQLQSPIFITFLIYLFSLMGLSFSGYFAPGARLMNLGQNRAAGTGLQHSFLTGVLATVVASPCSAPFMGTALGFAITQSTAVALLVFAFLGLGMAMPFLLLTWAPVLLRHLPKPGPWMEALKEFLAFPLYLTCVWLLWILGHQAGSDAVVTVVAGLVLLALAIWLGQRSRRLVRIAALPIIVLAILVPAGKLTQQEGDKPLWEPYSNQRLDSLLSDQRSVFVNLTADWCLTCLANEKVALSSEAFADTLASENIVYLKGDWTNYDPEITTLLSANGRGGVPLYLFYPKGQRPPIVLPQILSKQTVLRTLKQDL